MPIEIKIVNQKNMTKVLIVFIYGFLLCVNECSAQKTAIVIKTGHEANISRVSLSPDETKLFTVDADEFGILWDIPSGNQLRKFEKIMNGVFNSDGKSLLLALNTNIFKTVDLLGNTIKTFPGEPTDEYVLNNASTMFSDQGLMFYNNEFVKINTGEHIKLQCPEYSSSAYAPSKGIIAVGGQNTNSIGICDVKDGKLMKRVGMSSVLGFQRIQFLNFAQDDNILLAGVSESTNAIELYDYDANKLLLDIEFPGDHNFLRTAVLAPNAKTLVAVTKTNIIQKNAETGATIWSVPNTQDFSDAKFYHSGDRVVLIGGKKHIGLFDATTGIQLQDINSVNLADPEIPYLAADNKNLLLGSGNSIFKWNLAKGGLDKMYGIDSTSYFSKDAPEAKKWLTFPGNKTQLSFIEQNPDGTSTVDEFTASETGGTVYMANISYDGKYAYCSTEYKEDKPGAKYLSIWDLSRHTKTLEISDKVFNGAFMHTKNIFVSGSEYGNPLINFYDAPSGNLLYRVADTLNKYGPGSFTFSNTDKFLVIHHSWWLSILDLKTKKFLEPVIHPGADVIYRIAFTPDEKFLVLGDAHGQIFYYNLSTQTYSPSKPLSAHPGGFLRGMEAITFSKDMKFMITSGGDNTMKIWNFATQTLLATLYTFLDTNDWAVITPNGYFDASVGAQESMYYVRGVNTIALADLYEKFYTPYLLTRILNNEKINKQDIDIDNIHPKPRIKIQYAEKIRNLEVSEDSPLYANTTGLAELIINATAQDDKVDEIRLFHNGKIMNLATRGLFVTDDRTGNETKKYTISLLPGQNTFRAVALNGQRTESKADEISVNYKTDKPTENKPVQNNNSVVIDAVDKTATMYLVVIGINKYQNEKLSLNYALADATAFKDEIEKDAKTVLGNVKTFFVTDNTADKKGITDALTEVQKNAKPQDLFVFYYAGHGYISDKTKEFYLVPTDVADIKNVDEVLLQKGISAKMLQTYAIDIQAQKQIFILDACQSAGAFEALLTADANQQKSLAVVSRSTGTHWMAASGSKQYAQEFATLKHGAFTYVLLQALQGQAAANKMITVNGLKTFMQVQVPELMKKYNSAPQYPASYGLGNDFPVEIVK